MRGSRVDTAVRLSRVVGLGLLDAVGAGGRADAGRGQRRPVVGRLRPLHGVLVVHVQLLAVLGDADPVDPLVQGPHVVTAKVLNVLGLLLDLRMLQSQAVVGGSLVFGAVVLSVVHVNMVQLQETHQVSGRLGFAFWDVINPRGPEQEVSLLPRLLPVFFQPQDAFDFRHRHRASAETLLE